jgi:hypothetical protein
VLYCVRDDKPLVCLVTIALQLVLDKSQYALAKTGQSKVCESPRNWIQAT